MSLATCSFCEHWASPGTCRLGALFSVCSVCPCGERCPLLLPTAIAHQSVPTLYQGLELRLIHGKMSYYLYLHPHCSASIPKITPLVGDHKMFHKREGSLGPVIFILQIPLGRNGLEDCGCCGNPVFQDFEMERSQKPNLLNCQHTGILGSLEELRLGKVE